MCISLIFCLRRGNFFTAFVVFLCSLASSLRVVHMMCCRARIWLSMHVVILQQSTHISKGFNPVGCLPTPCFPPFHSDHGKYPQAHQLLVWLHHMNTHLSCFIPLIHNFHLPCQFTYKGNKLSNCKDKIISWNSNLSFQITNIYMQSKSRKKGKKETKRGCLCAATLHRAHILLTDSTSWLFSLKQWEDQTFVYAAYFNF